MTECEHDWETQPYREGESYHKLCILCGATEDLDPTDYDDGRDFTPPYEP